VFPIALLGLGALHGDVESLRPGDGKSVILKAWANATFYDPQMRDAILNGWSSQQSLLPEFYADSKKISGSPACPS